MSRILLITSPFSYGHITPWFGIVQWLKAQNHSVQWLSFPRPMGKYESQIRETGVEIVDSPPVSVPATVSAEELRSDPQAYRRWTLAYLESVPGQVEVARQLIRKAKPDVIASNASLYGALIAAYLERIPFASVSMNLQLLAPDDFEYPHKARWRTAEEPRRALFEKFGWQPMFGVNICVSPWLNVVFATEAFVGRDVVLPPHTFLVGPSLPPQGRPKQEGFPWHLIQTGKPTVYVSFGSLLNVPSTLNVVREVPAALGAQLVVSTGNAPVADVAEWLPSGVLAFPFVPQLEMLQRAHAFITHGGANSVTEALYYGVPMLILPQELDQPLQGEFVRRSGTGLSLSREEFSAEKFRTAISELISERSGFRDAARRVASSYQQRDGAWHAAKLIAALALTPRPPEGI